MNRLAALALLFAFISTSPLAAQIFFSNQTTLLKIQNVHSGVAMAVTDMNTDGLDDIVRLDRTRELRVEYQTGPGQPFETQFIDHATDDACWGIAAADLDADGRRDILLAGRFGHTFIYMQRADESFQKIDLPLPPQFFGQTISLANFGGSPRLDALICNQSGISITLKNNDLSGLSPTPALLPLPTVPPSDNAGAQASVFTDLDNDCDLDLFICRRKPFPNVPPGIDPREVNQVFFQLGNGQFAQDTTNASGLHFANEAWSADFGDVDNDGDMDAYILSSQFGQNHLLENDGAGHFTDVTALAPAVNDSIFGIPVQCAFRDFDNDGWLDLLVSGARPVLFQNLGGWNFVKLDSLPTCNPVQSFALGDLNHDGFTDYYAGYAQFPNTPTTTNDALFLNKKNANHWLGLTLRGVASNPDGIGARATLHSPAGIQIRDVRAGEGFGVCHSPQILFGIGKGTAVDSVVVCWPSGQLDVVRAPGIDQYLTLEEGGCVVGQVNIAAAGPLTFCLGDSVKLTAPAAFSIYKWNTGATTPGIFPKTTGNYKLTVTNAQGCTAVSNTLHIEVDPDETPTIVATGDTVLCAGFKIQLIADRGTAWHWSTGETTKGITVSEAGTYVVAAQGLCRVFDSKPVHVRVIEPELPVAVGDTVWPNFPATLTATGQELHWFDAASGGNKLFIGSPFVTPPLTATTQFWVANLHIEDQQNQFVGPPNHAGSPGPVDFNGQIIFDCYQPFRLKSVKVYSMTNVPKAREIELRDPTGKEIAKRLVVIPTGESRVTLNFDVPPGEDLVLTTGALTNIHNFGVEGPLLRRSDVGVAYPFEIQGVVELVGSNDPAAPKERFYYFYDWELDFLGHYCLSERVPVKAVVGTDVSAAGEVFGAKPGLRVWPNPADERVQVWVDAGRFDNVEKVIKSYNSVKIMDLTGKIWRQTPVTLPENGPLDLSVGDLPPGIFLLELSGSGGRLAARLVKF